MNRTLFGNSFAAGQSSHEEEFDEKFFDFLAILAATTLPMLVYSMMNNFREFSIFTDFQVNYYLQICFKLKIDDQSPTTLNHEALRKYLSSVKYCMLFKRTFSRFARKQLQR